MSFLVQRGQLVPKDGYLEYGLRRKQTLELFRAGYLGVKDICDAHPELIRVAENWGVKSGQSCPICNDAILVNTCFLFGQGLPKSGLPVTTSKELKDHLTAKKQLVCYVVEVCLNCSWNYLLRAFYVKTLDEIIQDQRAGSDK